MSAIDSLFQELKAAGQKAFMPFVTAGDPDLAFTSAILHELAARGSHLCEIGIPYSDPIADGPVIQESYTRALGGGVRLEEIFSTLANVTDDVQTPIVTMVSYAIVFRHGPQAYVEEARAAGLAGLIVPDLPVEESAGLAALCKAAHLSLIQLVTPTTNRDRALQIAATSTGFIYYVSVVGITGERKELPADLVDGVSWLREQTDLPICIGFGVSSEEHVRRLRDVADGIIVGSAIVRRIAAAGDDHKAAIRQVGEYVAGLIAALNPQS